MGLSFPDIQLLKSGYLLAALTDAEFQDVLASATVRTLSPGEQLFNQGEHCTHFYFVLSGLVKLYRIAPSGEEKVIDLVRNEHFFAEAVMFMGGQYPLYAQAIEASRLAVLDSAQFLELVRSNSNVSLRLLSNMSRRMHALINEIDNLTLHSGAQRVVRHLLDQLPQGVVTTQSVKLLAPKHVIASRLGMQPETLSRVLAKLRSEQLIDVHEETIVLRDIDALLRIV